MFKILKFIVKSNNFINIVKYFVLAFVFQLFKRMTNSVISKNIFNGKSIFLYPHCNVSTLFVYTDIPDKKEILLLRNLIGNKQDTVFMDIGANIGSYSICMMDVCDEIVAFEPHPYTAKRCKMNFLLNNYSENCVKQLALSNEIGKIYFSDFGGSSTINHIIDGDNGIEVDVSTLDNFIVGNNYTINKKYILKIDVEGFEKHVLLGGRLFLTSYDILGIIFECFATDDVFEILRDYGYIKIEKLSENNYYATKN